MHSTGMWHAFEMLHNRGEKCEAECRVHDVRIAVRSACRYWQLSRTSNRWHKFLPSLEELQAPLLCRIRHGDGHPEGT